MMGPTEQRATRPKLSSAERLSVRMDARPAPSAIIKGTVIGPVVTPPESKAVGIKSTEPMSKPGMYGKQANTRTMP